MTEPLDETRQQRLNAACDDWGLTIESTKARDGFIEFSGERLPTSAEKRQLEEANDFSSKALLANLDKVRIYIVVFVKPVGEATSDDIRNCRNRYKKALLWPEAYFVAFDGISQEAQK